MIRDWQGGHRIPHTQSMGNAGSSSAVSAAPVWGQSLDLAYSAPPTYLTPAASLPWDTPDMSVAPGLARAAYQARGPSADPVLQMREEAVRAVERGLFSETLSRELRGVATPERLKELDAILTKYPALAVMEMPSMEWITHMVHTADGHPKIGQVLEKARNVLFFGTSEPSPAQLESMFKVMRRLHGSPEMRQLLARAQAIGAAKVKPAPHLLREEAVRLLKRHAPSVTKLGLEAEDAGKLLAETFGDRRLDTLGELIHQAPRLGLVESLKDLATGSMELNEIKRLGSVLGGDNRELVIAIQRGLINLNESAQKTPIENLSTLLAMTREYSLSWKKRKDGPPRTSQQLEDEDMRRRAERDARYEMGGRFRHARSHRRRHRSARRARRSRSRHAGW